MPRVGEKEGSNLISLGAATMRVPFKFSAGIERYRETRMAKLLKTLNARIQSVLGLDFDGFTRAVILRKARFDEFLRRDAAQRRKILIDLLRLDASVEMGRRLGSLRKKGDSSPPASKTS